MHEMVTSKYCLTSKELCCSVAVCYPKANILLQSYVCQKTREVGKSEACDWLAADQLLSLSHVSDPLNTINQCYSKASWRLNNLIYLIA